jgi:hypothetical protein
MIQISPEDLESLKTRLDQWAEELKSMVNESANREKQHVASMPQFVGRSADAYRQHFDEMTGEINRTIEAISADQIAQMAGRASQLGQAFQQMDQEFGL